MCKGMIMMILVGTGGTQKFCQNLRLWRNSMRPPAKPHARQFGPGVAACPTATRSDKVLLITWEETT